MLRITRCQPRRVALSALAAIALSLALLGPPAQASGLSPVGPVEEGPNSSQLTHQPAAFSRKSGAQPEPSAVLHGPQPHPAPPATAQNSLASIPVSAPASRLAPGSYHTCALTTVGGVRCSGWNHTGQLGDGTYANRVTAVPVVGLSSGVVALASGHSHTCALTAAGGVKCWGSNTYGELGNGYLGAYIEPVDVVGLTNGVSAIATGSAHSCALTTTGGLRCWGGNHFGQLGDDTTTGRLTPVDVVGLSSGVVAVATGGQHTCALTTAGGVKCWGLNEYGRLGDGTLIERHTPVDVAGLGDGVARLAARGLHTCAITTAGGVKCWGYNSSGQLGDDTTADRNTPVDVVGLSAGVAAVATGGHHTCALTTFGGVKCWGANTRDQLGDGSDTYRHTPVDVLGLGEGATAIATGHDHSCAAASVGGVLCWGANSYGGLGDGTTLDRRTPVHAVGFGDSWKNLSIRTDSLDLTWDGEANPLSYALLIHITNTARATLVSLPGNSTGYSGATAEHGVAYCHALAALGPGSVLLGLSDVLCGVAGLESGTVAPHRFSLRLGATANATMTWDAPLGGSSLYLQRISLDEATITVIPLGGVATSTVQALPPAGACFRLVARRNADIGASDVLCGVPGLGTLSKQRRGTLSAEDLLVEVTERLSPLWEFTTSGALGPR